MTPHVPGPRLARGRTAEVYAWQEGQVLKLFYDWCGAHCAPRELDLARAVSAAGLPIPRPIGTVEIDGRPGIIYERVDGPSMLTVVNKKPWLTVRLARQLADLQAAIHAHPGDGFPALCPALRAAIESLPTLPPDVKAGLLRLLDTLPDGRALCHLDFHPDQVIMTAAGPVILDWLTAMHGPPAADVARTWLLLRIGQVPGAGRVQRALTNLWRGLFHRAYLARTLARHPALTRAELETWLTLVAAARLNEQIAGEEARLLPLIRAGLVARQPS